MRPQTLRPKNCLLKNITKKCVCVCLIGPCLMCYKVSRVSVISCDCAEFPVFLLVDSIRVIEEVIVIEKLRFLIRKAIRCALTTLQQSQFSTISGPTLTKTSSTQKHVDCKKESLRQRHWQSFELALTMRDQPAHLKCRNHWRSNGLVLDNPFDLEHHSDG